MPVNILMDFIYIVTHKIQDIKIKFIPVMNHTVLAKKID